MLFRQLLDPETSTYSYLLADEATREAILIDSVREQVPRDAELLDELELDLTHVLETHVHADHVTGGGQLRERLGCRLVVGVRSGVLTADRQVAEGDAIRFGRHTLEVRETPGHTDGCVSYVCHKEGMAFTGDALLIRGCGRTDFQQGDARTLFVSVREKILNLPHATRLYPGHDYRGRTVTTVAEEKRFNPRLGDAKSVEQFVELMGRLGLAYPRRMDEAVPANMASGITEPEPASPSSLPSDGWAPVKRTASGVPVVDAEWLAANRDAVRLVDVREHIEFCGPLGHVEGAELVPLALLSERARNWDRDAPVVTVCAYGTRSGKAACLLGDQGFARVASLHGGMVRWTDDGRSAVEVMGDRVQEDATVWQGMGI
ncbi:MAG: MBL fold metallo-hydrolase [Planctomycetota bacterium]|jgi:glyoxylase-like metal-dependent hydrolase (beta-lactamase superfamily II)/rhodanese-related sulfurtransferase